MISFLGAQPKWEIHFFKGRKADEQKQNKVVFDDVDPEKGKLFKSTFLDLSIKKVKSTSHRKEKKVSNRIHLFLVLYLTIPIFTMFISAFVKKY